jgi:ATPase family associated with various cellular activities (AAA)
VMKAEQKGYRPLFDPGAKEQPGLEGRLLRHGDEAPDSGYVYDDDGRIALAVNVALATGRPLLVRGKPGTGKSSLARDVAQRLKWRYYRATISSRTRARPPLDVRRGAQAQRRERQERGIGTRCIRDAAGAVVGSVP